MILASPICPALSMRAAGMAFKEATPHLPTAAYCAGSSITRAVFCPTINSNGKGPRYAMVDCSGTRWSHRQNQGLLDWAIPNLLARAQCILVASSFRGSLGRSTHLFGRMAWLRIQLRADAFARLSFLRRARTMEWQTIDTAPKDGTEFIAFKQQKKFGHPLVKRIVLASYKNGFIATMPWCRGESSSYTHWMPLPAPPASDR